MTGVDVLGVNPPNQDFLPQVPPYAHPYASPISSASSSSTSVFSVDGASSSQSSISSSSTSTNLPDMVWENDGAPRFPHPNESNSRNLRHLVNGAAPRRIDPPVPPHLRRHPRRTSSWTVQNGIPVLRPPPSLVRQQSERKVNFVDSLVDSASQIVENIWPLSAKSHPSDSAAGNRGVLPLRTFIQETLRRSRTSYCTLQVALYYLIKVKSQVPRHDISAEQIREKPQLRAMQCGRRMFLAALILASKYLQDRNYSARAWSKISGLNTKEINQNELMFLDAVEWRLHIPEPTYYRWTNIVLKLTPGASGWFPTESLCWRTVLPRLTPELKDNIELGSPISPASSFSGYDLDSLSPRSPPACEMPSLSSGEPSPTCPRNIPMTLEPTPRVDYPSSSFPPVPRPPMLPTPQMAPQSSITFTPAVSIDTPSPRRPSSIGVAMSQAQNACVARSTIDQRPQAMPCPKTNGSDGYPSLVRRASLGSSNTFVSRKRQKPTPVSSGGFARRVQEHQNPFPSNLPLSRSSSSDNALDFCSICPEKILKLNCVT